MAPINSLTWTAFYDQHRKDGGAIQSRFDREVGEFAETTTSHFQNPNGLAQTIGGSAYANVVIVPGEKGRVNILHHGFTCNTRDGFSLIFIQGNLSDCAYFKVLRPIEATNEIKAPSDGVRRTPYINWLPIPCIHEGRIDGRRVRSTRVPRKHDSQETM